MVDPDERDWIESDFAKKVNNFIEFLGGGRPLEEIIWNDNIKVKRILIGWGLKDDIWVKHLLTLKGVQKKF